MVQKGHKDGQNETLVKYFVYIEDTISRLWIAKKQSD